MSEPKPIPNASADVAAVKNNADSGQGKPRKVLSLFDSICIIVGIIIGSGIFKTAPFIAQLAGNVVWLIGFWIFGGILALIGALCFVELTSRYKDQVGGDYLYLKHAYGSRVAFLFAWVAFWVIRPGNIGAMAMVFATYFNQILPVESVIGWDSLIPYALLAVAVLSAANLIGLRQGKLVQNVLTVSKVAGIGAIIVIAFLSPAASASEAAPAVIRPEFGSIWLAMVLVMFTYGGWNDVAFVAGEVREPKKNLFRSLILGTSVVMALYVLINLAFIFGMGFNAMAASEAVASDLVLQCCGPETWLGQTSEKLISALVCIACLGAINGMIIVGPRLYYALGCDFEVFAPLAQWSLKRDGPWQATLVQALITSGLMLLCLGYADAFNVIVYVTAPYFWAFLGLTVLSLLVFRIRKIDADGDYFRVPLFPLLPIVFAAICFCLVYASTAYVITEKYFVAAAVVLAFMLVGIGLSFGLKSGKNGKV